MKKNKINGVVAILGLLVALGPKFLFRVCESGCCADVSQCYWSAQALLGMGMLITALGICFFIFTDPNTQIGLLIGVFLSGIVAISIPHSLIGGCPEPTMACRRVAFPVVTVICIILLVFTIVMMFMANREKRHHI